MTDVKRWCENPVNGGPWVVLESDYDALAARLAEADKRLDTAVALLSTFNSRGHTVGWQKAVKDFVATTDSASPCKHAQLASWVGAKGMCVDCGEVIPADSADGAS
jgi:hypothetical protein